MLDTLASVSLISVGGVLCIQKGDVCEQGVAFVQGMVHSVHNLICISEQLPILIIVEYSPKVLLSCLLEF